jgi:hypothetical protein
MSSDAGPSGVGLCAGCVHSRTTANRRGSRFYLCKRSRLDPDYPRYPTLPVWACDGFEVMEVSRKEEESR